MKYTITQLSGCTALGIYVNGMQYPDNVPDLNEFHDAMFLEIRRRLEAGYVGIESLVELLEETGHETSGPCGQCGDHISETTYQISAVQQ